MNLEKLSNAKQLIPVVFYIAGYFFIDHSDMDYGKVLTYEDIYLAAIPMLLLSACAGMCIFGEKVDEAKCIMLGNCVLGFLLIYLTTKGYIVSTIMFWLGIIAAGFTLQTKEKP